LLKYNFFIATWWSPEKMESRGVWKDCASKTSRWDCGGRTRNSQTTSS